jgi:hypothetical protein
MSLAPGIGTVPLHMHQLIATYEHNGSSENVRFIYLTSDIHRPCVFFSHHHYPALDVYHYPALDVYHYSALDVYHYPALDGLIRHEDVLVKLRFSDFTAFLMSNHPPGTWSSSDLWQWPPRGLAGAEFQARGL